MRDHKYRVIYNMIHEPDGLEVKDVPAGHGATDALFLASIVRGADGSTSTVTVSMDGDTGADLSPDEVFKLWALMAHQLVDQLPPGGRRDLCHQTFEAVRSAVLGGD